MVEAIVEVGACSFERTPVAVVAGSYNIVVFLTICISYANNCFTL